ncbi:hypothetical protein CS022_12600 [Veronia nyctiphanis]|uniref:Uncharacterized protein n=1 Tax=Veronia nyctiphanis TaxID=1278244 RepID=A0A4Q0YPG5_9GAMM|nr:hypothetical protein [Veronia nyctiphanis]RXJ72920.1 hypothetical protein CS022_12600 [Veronia nyctiphanis]
MNQSALPLSGLSLKSAPAPTESKAAAPDTRTDSETFKDTYSNMVADDKPLILRSLKRLRKPKVLLFRKPHRQKSLKVKT